MLPAPARAASAAQIHAVLGWTTMRRLFLSIIVESAATIVASAETIVESAATISASAAAAVASAATIVAAASAVDVCAATIVASASAAESSAAAIDVHAWGVRASAAGVRCAAGRPVQGAMRIGHPSRSCTDCAEPLGLVWEKADG